MPAGRPPSSALNFGVVGPPLAKSASRRGQATHDSIDFPEGQCDGLTVTRHCFEIGTQRVVLGHVPIITEPHTRRRKSERLLHTLEAMSAEDHQGAASPDLPDQHPLLPGRAAGRPTPKSKTVSQQMSRMPRTSTKPEVALRRELHARGLRFRLHPAELPGRPDITLTRARIAIFVDGCFWHRCPAHCVMPKNNAEWWDTKLRGNVDRDRRKDSALEALGFVTVHVWEHESPEQAAAMIERLWRLRTGRLARSTDT